MLSLGRATLPADCADEPKKLGASTPHPSTASTIKAVDVAEDDGEHKSLITTNKETSDGGEVVQLRAENAKLKDQLELAKLREENEQLREQLEAKRQGEVTGPR
jgi:hypothetical protein